MLLEWLTHLRTPCPQAARRLGYLREQIAIRARHRRHRQAWQGHLEACRSQILAAAEACARHEVVAVVGGGVCLDVPVAELAERFKQVVLLDVAFLDRQGPANVTRLHCDVTGGLAGWHDHPAEADEAVLAAARQPPPWPDGQPRPDLTISANLISQLHLLPAAWLDRQRRRPDDFPHRLGLALAAAHVDWLRALPGSRLLIADIAELAVGRDSRIADRQPTVTAEIGLRAPDLTWSWELAPIPEWDRDLHLQHQVGAWRDP